jgi:crossover junction endodeoxyribonuclease RuvC
MAEICVLGLDPGTRRVGYALLAASGRRLSLIEAGVLVANLRLPYALRLGALYKELCTLVARLAPHEAAIEATFVGINARSALKIGEGRGVALAALANCGLTPAEYPPAIVKRAATGKGAASKQQVARMMALQLGLRDAPKPEDATDACAIALCHINRRK